MDHLIKSRGKVIFQKHRNRMRMFKNYCMHIRLSSLRQTQVKMNHEKGINYFFNF